MRKVRIISGTLMSKFCSFTNSRKNPESCYKISQTVLDKEIENSTNFVFTNSITIKTD